MIWDGEEKLCAAVEINCSAGVNKKLKIEEKENIYTEIMGSLQLLYPDYICNYRDRVICNTLYTNFGY